EGVEPLRAREPPVGFLQVARRHVVQTGVAQQVGRNIIGLPEPAARAADYRRDFTLEVHTLRDFRQQDRFLGADYGGRRLQEDQRLFGNGIVQLGGVLDIVAALADHLRRHDRRKQAHLTDRPRASRAISFSLEWPEDLPGRIPFEDGKARRNGCTAFFVRRGRSDQKGLYADELHSL